MYLKKGNHYHFTANLNASAFYKTEARSSSYGPWQPVLMGRAEMQSSENSDKAKQNKIHTIF